MRKVTGPKNFEDNLENYITWDRKYMIIYSHRINSCFEFILCFPPLNLMICKGSVKIQKKKVLRGLTYQE